MATNMATGDARICGTGSPVAVTPVDEPSGPRLSFRLLGPLEVAGGTRSCRVVGTRLAALLAALLLNGDRVVSTGRLARALWDAPPRAARSNIRTYVAELRRLLVDAGGQRSLLTTEPTGYRLRIGPHELDAVRFERLAEQGERALRLAGPGAALPAFERALSLWRGEALAGLAATSLLRDEAARLEERRYAVVEQWASAALAVGRHREVVTELVRLVRTQPLRERAWELLMLALYRDGRQAEALAAYRQVYRVLGEELGVTPGAALQTRQRQLLAHDPALDAPVPPDGPTGYRPAAAPPWRAATRAPDPARPGGHTTVVIWIGGDAADVPRRAGDPPADPGGGQGEPVRVDLNGYAAEVALAAIDALARSLRALAVAPAGRGTGEFDPADGGERVTRTSASG
jgi:DNA-binding SARP family transcriptional activator